MTNAENRNTIWPVRLLIVASAVLLGAGLAGPCMAIEPAFGTFDGWVRLLKPAMARPTHYSVFGGITAGITALVHNGNVALGVLLLAFSVVFPTIKLGVMAAATAALAEGHAPGPLMKVAHHAGKFSMLDVFVVGLIVLAIKGLPGGSRVTLGWGVGAFSASVLLSMVAALLITRTERRAAPPATVEPAVAEAPAVSTSS
jgi:hypothetical protein